MVHFQARRRGARGKKRRSGTNTHAQSAGHASGSRQDSTGFHAGSSGHSSGSNPSRAGQQGQVGNSGHHSRGNPSTAGQQGQFGNPGHPSGSNPSTAGQQGQFGNPGHPSGSNPSTASQQGSYSARLSIPYQEDPYPAAPQDLDSSEILAHAYVRGFRMKTIKPLLKFLQRKTTTTGDAVEIRESRLDGNGLIIAVKAKDLPRITKLNGTMYARLRLAIRPYQEKNPIRESPLLSDNGGLRISTGPIPNADSPRLSSDEHATRSQPTDITPLASRSLASSKPDGRMRILPGLDALAAATASSELLQQEFLPQANEEVQNTSPATPTMTKEKEVEIHLSQIAGISPVISKLCLSQCDWNMEVALEAVKFAQEFAVLHGITLQTSILCLDRNLWDMDSTALFLQTVVQEVSDKTNITMDWAVQCLEGNGWMVNQAIDSFEDLKHLMPFEAFKRE